MINSIGKKCGYCGKDNPIQAQHEVICGGCGVVIGTIDADMSAEFNSDINNKRTGAASTLTLHDRGLSTTMESANKDYTGKSLNTQNRTTMKRLRVWNSRSIQHKNDSRNLSIALRAINNIIDKTSLPENVGEHSALIYRRALEKKLIRGRSVGMLAVSCVYAACRELGIHRTLKEMAIVSDVKRKDIARCFRLISRELELQPMVVSPESCVTKVASLCNVNSKVSSMAVKLIRMAHENESTAGKDPVGLAAAAIYLAAVHNNVNITQRNIALRAEITEVTIRNRAKGLREMLNEKGKTR